MAGVVRGTMRGATAIMVADLAAPSVSGIRVQSVGDSHISNFGIRAMADAMRTAAASPQP